METLPDFGAVKPSKNKSSSPLAPEQERFMQACSDIARTLIQIHEANENKDVNLNALRGQISRKYRLKTIPPLTAIIAAIPEHYKKYLLPKLIAKPIRTSSGIAVVAVMCKPHRCPHIAYVSVCAMGTRVIVTFGSLMLIAVRVLR